MTLTEILDEHRQAGRTFLFGWRIFLDTFYAADAAAKASLVSSPPQCLEDIREQAYCAAGVHKLCRENGIGVPAWVMDKKYILEDPYFPSATTDLLQLICLVESPPEFKMRNIFTTENALSRT